MRSTLVSALMIVYGVVMTILAVEDDGPIALLWIGLMTVVLFFATYAVVMHRSKKDERED